MAFEATVDVTNSSDTVTLLHLEPWGEQIEMPLNATFSIHAEAEEAGAFEIEHLEQEIIVWAWSTAIVKVFWEGVEIGIGAGDRRPPVPTVPEGKRVSSFLKRVLGKERVIGS